MVANPMTQRLCNKNNGFTLLESIIAIIMIGFLVAGLYLAWYFSQTRQQGMEDFWQAKDTLELAYEITHRELRRQAQLSTINISPDAQTISFTGRDSAAWSFSRSGNNFIRTRAGVSDTLITGICNLTSFSRNGNMVSISLGVVTPPTWLAGTTLQQQGQVYVRNP